MTSNIKYMVVLGGINWLVCGGITLYTFTTENRNDSVRLGYWLMYCMPCMKPCFLCHKLCFGIMYIVHIFCESLVAFT